MIKATLVSSRVIRVSNETFRRLQAWGTGFTGSERGTPDKALGAVLSAAGSPVPDIEVAYLDLGRGWKWYVLQDVKVVGVERAVRGGPYASREEAQAEVDRRYQEMSDEYDAFNGPGVTWAPETKEEA